MNTPMRPGESLPKSRVNGASSIIRRTTSSLLSYTKFFSIIRCQTADSCESAHLYCSLL